MNKHRKIRMAKVSGEELKKTKPRGGELYEKVS